MSNSRNGEEKLERRNLIAKLGTGAVGAALVVIIYADTTDAYLYWPVASLSPTIIPALPASRDMSGWAGPYEVFGPSHNIRVYGTSAPNTGTWAVGDVCINTNPSAGGAPGWACVTGGSPGTWKAMANLAS